MPSHRSLYFEKTALESVSNFIVKPKPFIYSLRFYDQVLCFGLQNVCGNASGREDLMHLWFTQFLEQSLPSVILIETVMRLDPCLSALTADVSHRTRGHGLLAELLSSVWYIHLANITHPMNGGWKSDSTKYLKEAVNWIKSYLHKFQCLNLHTKVGKEEGYVSLCVVNSIS